MRRIDWVRSFVHRRLKRTAIYSDARETPVASAVPCGDAEVLVGVYENTPGEAGDALGITDSGLYLNRDGVWRFIAYEHIVGSDLPDKSKEPPFIAPHLDLCLRGGEVVRLPVRGRTGDAGQFSDVYAMEYFLRGMVWSLARSEADG